MKLKWEDDVQGGIMKWSKGEYSEWRLMPPIVDPDTEKPPIYVLVRIMLNPQHKKEGVQVGEFYDIETAYKVAQLVEDGKIVDYPDEEPQDEGTPA